MYGRVGICHQPLQQRATPLLFPSCFFALLMTLGPARGDGQDATYTLTLQQPALPYFVFSLSLCGWRLGVQQESADRLQHTLAMQQQPLTGVTLLLQQPQDKSVTTSAQLLCRLTRHDMTVGTQLLYLTTMLFVVNQIVRYCLNSAGCKGMYSNANSIQPPDPPRGCLNPIPSALDPIRSSAKRKPPISPLLWRDLIAVFLPRQQHSHNKSAEKQKNVPGRALAEA